MKTQLLNLHIASVISLLVMAMGSDANADTEVFGMKADSAQVVPLPADNFARGFVLRAKYGSSYSPQQATGIFGDVDLSFWVVHWIEQLAAEGITAGWLINGRKTIT